MELQSTNTTPTPASRFWNETPIRTYLFDAFSVLLPAGEAFVIEAIEAAMREAPADAEMAPACRAFVAEERSHQRAHRQYNERLAGQGYRVMAFEREITADLARLSADLSVNRRLCLAAAFEHITAAIARAALRNDRLLAPSGSVQCRTWRWHCAEELAHAAVTRDLLAYRQIGYFARVGCFVLASLLLAGDVLRLVCMLYSDDRASGRVSAWALCRSVVELLASGVGAVASVATGWAGYWVPRVGSPAWPAATGPGICARALLPSDVPALLQLEGRCWAPEQAASASDLRARIASHPQLSIGAFCTRTGAALASLFMKPTDHAAITQAMTWRDCARDENARHDGTASNALFGISLSSVDADAVKSIFEYFWPRALKGGWRQIFLGSPVPGLRAWMERHPGACADDYVRSRRAGAPLDPQLRYYHLRGFRHIVAVRADYFPHADSLDHGVLIRGTIPGSLFAPLWRHVPLAWLEAAKTRLSKLL
jgi:predicted metal-dependent hydrolase